MSDWVEGPAAARDTVRDATLGRLLMENVLVSLAFAFPSVDLLREDASRSESSKLNVESSEAGRSRLTSASGLEGQ